MLGVSFRRRFDSFAIGVKNGGDIYSGSIRPIYLSISAYILLYKTHCTLSMDESC